MSQGRHRVYAAFIARLPPSQPALHPDDLAAVGPWLLIRQVLPYLLISQLTFISEGRSPIRHLRTHGMAVQLCTMSLTYNRNKSGPNTDPWQSPQKHRHPATAKMPSN